ncbi:hypothetical protein [Chitinophaga hostae]
MAQIINANAPTAATGVSCGLIRSNDGSTSPAAAETFYPKKYQVLQIKPYQKN